MKIIFSQRQVRVFRRLGLSLLFFPALFLFPFGMYITWIATGKAFNIFDWVMDDLTEDNYDE